MTRAILSIYCALICCQVGRGDEPGNWANWRGPNYDGSLAEGNPPLTWSASENIQWKVPVPGEGKSTPIIWENRLFLLSAIESQSTSASRGSFQFTVLAYDLESGEELWRTAVREAVPHEAGHPTNSFASSSPVTDGQHLYVSFGSQGIYCLTLDGDIVWEKDLGQMQTRNEFGEGGSPALHEDTLVVPWDHEGPSKLFALDARSGEIKWETSRDERTTWSTPLIVENDGRHQVVTNGTRVRSYDLTTGKMIWECGGQAANPIPCPVQVDDFVICMTGYRGNAIYALPLDAEGDITGSSEILWHREDAAPYVASPALFKGRVYFSKSRDGIASSVDAHSGEVVIPPTRLTDVRDMYASPIAVADRIYFTSREGVTTVIKHGENYEELAVNKLDEPVDASPAVSGDRIFIRSDKHLFCIAAPQQ